MKRVLVFIFIFNLSFQLLCHSDELVDSPYYSILKNNYSGLRESIQVCKDSVSNTNNCIIVDIGCAIGDFVQLLDNIGLQKYQAYGIDPVLKFYGPHPHLSLYKQLFDGIIGETNENVEINVYLSELSLSSVKNIDIEEIKRLPDYEYWLDLKYNFDEKNCIKLVVPSMKLDLYFQSLNIEKIDILKIDTQGNEFEILKSISPELFQRIHLIYVETSVPSRKGLYKQQASFDDIYKHLQYNGFEFIGAYGLDDCIILENSIDINCIFLNKN